MATVEWEFTDDELAELRTIVSEQAESPFLRHRRSENVEPRDVQIGESEFWEALIVSLLTSRQRSGPESEVFRFVREEIERLALERCRSVDDVARHVSTTLEEHGGIRYYNNIGAYCQTNLERLDSDGGWEQLWDQLATVQDARTREPRPSDYALERDVCEFLRSGLAGGGLQGIGPKQARNLLQILDLTRYETPLDSRITEWLNEQFDLPYRVTGQGLSNPEYYCFVMDIVRAACTEADVLPCVFDAAVFSSYDDTWSEEAAKTTF